MENAPEFNLKDQDGQLHRLSEYKGKYIVLYFYPKDMTPGCTKEACDFRDSIDEFKKLNAVVLGISKDNEKSHQKFADKHKLNFPLLIDDNAEVCKLYGVLKEKSMFGRKYMGIVRTTFLIDPDGKIVKKWDKVKVLGHNEEVLDELRKHAKVSMQ